jgi:YidC/Oxa1 family membrane protein insertase
MPVRLKVLAATGLLREPDTGAAFQDPNMTVLRTAAMADTSIMPSGVEVIDGAEIGSLRILGTRSHFFLSTYFMDKGWTGSPTMVRIWATGEASRERPAMENHVAAYFRDVRGRDPDEDAQLLQRIKVGVENMHHAWLVLDLPSGTDAISAEGTAVEIPLYVGPVSRLVFRQDAYAPIKPIIDYRMALDVIADALLGIYDFFRNLLGSVGLGVILMTLVVRGLMMPLSIKNQLSMRGYSRKIAKLKPKLDVLKKRYATNPKKMRDEQTKLYREHGVGFPTGCLMMFIQIPIFFALFSSLRMEFTLRNAGFLWIIDMAAPDRLIDFGKTLFDIGILKVFSLNILPLIMVALSLWQQRLMPKPADEQQAQQMKMMKWLPIFFAVILYNYSAALSIYMVMSSAVSIIESRIVRRLDPNPDAPGAAPMPTM